MTRMETSSNSNDPPHQRIVKTRATWIGRNRRAGKMGINERAINRVNGRRHAILARRRVVDRLTDTLHELHLGQSAAASASTLRDPTTADPRVSWHV